MTAAPRIHPQFDDHPQQREAATLGMWVFLATEVLLFGGLFTAYAVYRSAYPRAFAEGSGHLYFWIATANTAILLVSSLFMALATHAAVRRRTGGLTLYLALTALTGLSFLTLKAAEYYLDWTERVIPGANFDASRFENPAAAELFFILYFLLTGVHALHMTIGVSLILLLTVLASRRHFERAGPNTVIIVGLYIQLVDIIWTLLYPMLYMVE